MTDLTRAGLGICPLPGTLELKCLITLWPLINLADASLSASTLLSSLYFSPLKMLGCHACFFFLMIFQLVFIIMCGVMQNIHVMFFFFLIHLQNDSFMSYSVCKAMRGSHSRACHQAVAQAFVTLVSISTWPALQSESRDLHADFICRCSPRYERQMCARTRHTDPNKLQLSPHCKSAGVGVHAHSSDRQMEW